MKKKTSLKISISFVVAKEKRGDERKNFRKASIFFPSFLSLLFLLKNVISQLEVYH